MEVLKNEINQKLREVGQLATPVTEEERLQHQECKQQIASLLEDIKQCNEQIDGMEINVHICHGSLPTFTLVKYLGLFRSN